MDPRLVWLCNRSPEGEMEQTNYINESFREGNNNR